MDQNSFSPIPKILKVKFKWFFSLSQFCSKQEKTFLVGELIFMWFLWKRKNYNQDGSDDWIMFRIWQFSIFWSTPWILLKFWESIQNDATKLWKKYCMLNQLLTVNHAKYKLWNGLKKIAIFLSSLFGFLSLYIPIFHWPFFP